MLRRTRQQGWLMPLIICLLMLSLIGVAFGLLYYMDKVEQLKSDNEEKAVLLDLYRKDVDHAKEINFELRVDYSAMLGEYAAMRADMLNMRQKFREQSHVPDGWWRVPPVRGPI